MSPDIIHILLKHSIDGILAFDLEYRYTVWNPPMEMISGKKQEEVLGRKATEVFPFLVETGEFEYFLRTLQGETLKVENSSYNIPESGKRGFFDAHYFPLVHPDGTVYGGMAVIHETTKRIEAEDQLRVINEQLLEAQEIACMGNWIFDISTGVSHWSDQVYRLFLADRKNYKDTFEVLERHVFPEDYAIIQQFAGNAIRNGVPYQSQYRIIRTDGALRMISTRARPERDQYGNVRYLKGICQDITERWEAHEKINEKNAFISHVMDASPNMIYVYSLPAKKNIYINRNIEALLGYTMEEAMGMGERFNELLYHPDDFHQMEDKLRFYAGQKEDAMYESDFRMKGKSGGWRWFHGREKVFKRDAEGRVLEVIGSIQDITDKRKAEEDLRQLNAELEERVKRRTQQLEESAERFRLLIEAIPQMAWTSLPNGTVSYMNKAWYDFTGVSRIDASNWKGLVFEEDLPRTEELWRHSMETGNLFEVEYRWRRHDGTVRWMLGRANPIRDAEGNIVLWIGTATDIHEQKLIQEKLSEAQKNLHQMNQELMLKNKELTHTNADLDNFIYTASHDLKAPISNIEGLVLAIADEIKVLNSQQVDRMFKMIFSSIEKFKITIRDLTEISKIQKSLDEHGAEQLDVAEILEEVIVLLSKPVKEHGVQIRTAIEVDRIYFQRKNIRSVLLNLLSNSIKYRSSHRECFIDFKVKRQGSHILLSVSDNGIGFNPEQKDKIFGMFKRLHDHVDGNGIGLYIVKKIVDNAGGRIEVETCPGEGTTFEIFLPAGTMQDVVM